MHESHAQKKPSDAESMSTTKPLGTASEEPLIFNAVQDNILAVLRPLRKLLNTFS